MWVQFRVVAIPRHIIQLNNTILDINNLCHFDIRKAFDDYNSLNTVRYFGYK